MSVRPFEDRPELLRRQHEIFRLIEKCKDKVELNNLRLELGQLNAQIDSITKEAVKNLQLSAEAKKKTEPRVIGMKELMKLINENHKALVEDYRVTLEKLKANVELKKVSTENRKKLVELRNKAKESTLTVEEQAWVDTLREQLVGIKVAEEVVEEVFTPTVDTDEVEEQILTD